MNRKNFILGIIGILTIAMLLITFVFKDMLSDIYYYNKAVKLLDLNVQYMEESSKHYRNGKMDKEGMELIKKLEKANEKLGEYISKIKSRKYKNMYFKKEQEYLKKIEEVMGKVIEEMNNKN